jgi:molecular chaperone GrpE
MTDEVYIDTDGADDDVDTSDDVVYENDTATSQDKIKDLREKLKACQQERQEYLDGWQRAKADVVNIKKRSADEQGAFLERVGSSFIEELLPVLDSFDMAFKNKEAWEAAPEQWRKGVEYIHGQLVSIIESRGVRIIDPVGTPFNHHEHHSLASVPVTDAAQDGIVISVIRKGYKQGDTIIRPADVQVGTTA